MDLLTRTPLVLLLGMVSCFDPGLDGRFACGVDGACPSGLHCAPDGVCRAPARTEVQAPESGSDAAVPRDGGFDLGQPLPRFDLASPSPDLAGAPRDMASVPHDLASPPPDLATPPRDLASPPPDLACVRRVCGSKDCGPRDDGCGGTIECPLECRNDDEVCGGGGPGRCGRLD